MGDTKKMVCDNCGGMMFTEEMAKDAEVLKLNWTIGELEHLILDLTSFNLRTFETIQAETGLPDKRCKQMEEKVQDIVKKYAGRYRIEMS